jgi:hypothetical protein
MIIVEEAVKDKLPSHYLVPAIGFLKTDLDVRRIVVDISTDCGGYLMSTGFGINDILSLLTRLTIMIVMFSAGLRLTFADAN